MSQLEQDFSLFIGKNPEIEKCYQAGLINRRSLARFLINHNIGTNNQFQAIVAMLRRYKFKSNIKDVKNIFKDVKINIKDKITIINFDKDKELVKKLEKIIVTTDYDKGDTLKIVVGSSSISVFIDNEKEKKLNDLFDKFSVINKIQDLTEMSLIFPTKAMASKGILSTVTRELVINDITISELLTTNSELLIYLKEEYVMKAYEIIKKLK
jgi:hypothetical protein